MSELDQRDRVLLHALQTDVPLASTPFAVIGQRIDMAEKEVLKRSERLRRDGHLRQIYATFETRLLGYKSCLVAAKVDDDQTDRAASVINLHPGVFQNYKRNHSFNLWFTIAVPPNSKLGLERTVEILGDEAGCTAIRTLPTLRLFKTQADSNDSSESAEDSHEPLTEGEIESVRLLQKELPLLPRPFDVLARSQHMSGDDLIDAANRLARRQQLKRYAAAAPHKKPFSTTAMGVWAVPASRIEEVGAEMANHRGVVQCFLRPTYDDWPYNLFTTVHGRSVDECETLLSEVADQIQIVEMKALFPLKEYKQGRIALFSDDHDAWESSREEGKGVASAAS